VTWSAPSLDSTWLKGIDPNPGDVAWSSHSLRFKVAWHSTLGTAFDPVEDSVYYRFKLTFTKIESLL
jgi:hypothetical protein